MNKEMHDKRPVNAGGSGKDKLPGKKSLAAMAKKNGSEGHKARGRKWEGGESGTARSKRPAAGRGIIQSEQKLPGGGTDRKRVGTWKGQSWSHCPRKRRRGVKTFKIKAKVRDLSHLCGGRGDGVKSSTGEQASTWKSTKKRV